jgi:3-isopropylmalate/(R)-2-methylmalate dehydratase small subunit
MIACGRVWKFGDDINTDLMVPGTVLRKDAAEQMRHVFEANRPGWVRRVRPGDVIVAGRNFGMGSSRPAARALRNLGLAFLAAEEINGLFFRMCVNQGFLAIECPGVSLAFEEGDIAELSFERWTLTNPRTQAVLSPVPIPAPLLAMMREGGVLPLLEAEGLVAPG